MEKDIERRIAITKGILASGMVLVGLATGSTTFFSLLINTSVGVGGNLLANIVDKAFDRWKNGWLTLHDSQNNLRVALQRTFIETTQQLEAEWQKHDHYRYLKIKGEHERAKLSITLIQNMREDAERLFQNNDEWQNLCKQENIHQLFGDDPTEMVSKEFLSQIVDKYFNVIEPLAEFSKSYLGSKWPSLFISYIQTEDGVSAWRACQILWQSSLTESLANVQVTLDATSEDVSSIKRDIEQISAWLVQWQSQGAAVQTGMEYELTVNALSKAIEPAIKELQQKVESLTKDSQTILEFFRETFCSLDSESIFLNFLQKEMIREQNVNLEQAGHQAEEEISLSEVFIDLPVLDEYTYEPPDEDATLENLPGGLISELITASQEQLDPRSLQIKINSINRGSESEKYQKIGKYVLLGGPGQGKTTICQLACQLFRTAILQQKQGVVYPPKVNNVIRDIIALCESERIPLPTVPRIPFRIVLSDFAERLATQDSKITSLLSYITSRIQERTGQVIEVKDLRNWLGKYPWFLVLDGLDEVPASSNRDEVMNAIDDFWVDANGENADILVVATTRPQGYNKEFAPNAYQHLYLTPLSNARAIRYGNRLVEIRYRDDLDRQKKILERIENALEEETTARLMRSPLQVTIMTSLLGHIGTPPKERWSLFSQYYNVIYERESERHIAASVLLRNYKSHINAIHYRVGLLLQIESEHPERTASKLSRDRFEKLVEIRLIEEGYEGELLSQLREQIIDAAVNRLVFLVGVEAGVIGFEIRSFQEFMAAEALTDCRDEVFKDRLLAISTNTHWRNVFLFAAGKCFVQKQYLRDTIYSICASLNEAKTSEHEIEESTKTGSKLALAILEDGVAINQPKYTKSFTRLALQILRLPPSDAHLRLSSIYTHETAKIFEEEIGNILSAPYPQNLGAWTVISTLPNDQWVTNTIDKFWPCTPEEQVYLLDAVEQYSNLEWFALKLGDNILQVPMKEVVSRVEIPGPFDFGSVFPWKYLSQWNGAFPSMEVQLRISEEKDVPWQFRLSSIIPRKKDALQNQDMTKFIEHREDCSLHSDWLPFIAGLHFIQDPSKEVLSSEIKRIAPLLNYDFLQHNCRRYSNLPWILYVLLRTARSEKELLDLAQKLEHGEFGDYNEWCLAEERWMTNGVTIDDFNHMTNKNWPINKEIGRIGFPLVINYVLVVLSSEGESYKIILDLFNRILADNQFSKLNQMISEWKAFLIGVINKRFHQSDIVKKEDLDWFADRGGKGYQVPLNIFSSYSRFSRGSEFIGFAERMGQNTKWFLRAGNEPEIDHKAIVDILTKAFIENPNRQGLLPVLASYLDYDLRPEIPSGFLRENLTGEKFRVSQMLLRLVNKDSSRPELMDMAIDIANHVEYLSWGLGRILRTIRIRKMVDNDTQYFLLCLFGELKQHENHKPLQSVIEALEDIISQMRSNLVDRWEVLELPKKLDTLVTK